MTLPVKVIAQNRKARHDYHIEDTFEAGIVLHGSEVKSMRAGNTNIKDAYATEKEGELFLLNSFVGEYKQANQFNHEPRRPRKLLVRSRELRRLIGSIQRKGITLVPLQLYFNKKGIVKVQIGLAKGKDKLDKRATIKEREWKREKARVLKNQG